MQFARHFVSLASQWLMQLIMEAWAASVVVALAAEDAVAVAVVEVESEAAEATRAKTPARMRDVKRILAVVLAISGIRELRRRKQATERESTAY
jgi:hypothetical protein